MAMQNTKDLKWSKSEEAITLLSSIIPNADEYPAEQNRVNHMCEQADTSCLDLGKDYIDRLIKAAEEIFSKPREGTHVTELCLCLRQRVFKAIDPLPIGKKTVSIFSAGKAIHGTISQWLFPSERKRFEREKHLEFRGIMGRVDIYDKIRNIPLEKFLTTRSTDISEPRLDEVIKSQYNSIEELKKELEKDERTAELEKENVELKEQLSKK
jgi:hypothetical protein